jgi:hypothetical protein
LIDISGLSPQEVSGTTQTFATSDTSLINNYLISPETGGRAQASQTAQTASVGNLGIAKSKPNLLSKSLKWIGDATMNSIEWIGDAILPFNPVGSGYAAVEIAENWKPVVEDAARVREGAAPTRWGTMTPQLIKNDFDLDSVYGASP